MLAHETASWRPRRLSVKPCSRPGRATRREHSGSRSLPAAPGTVDRAVVGRSTCRQRRSDWLGGAAEEAHARHWTWRPAKPRPQRRSVTTEAAWPTAIWWWTNVIIFPPCSFELVARRARANRHRLVRHRHPQGRGHHRDRCLCNAARCAIGWTPVQQAAALALHSTRACLSGLTASPRRLGRLKRIRAPSFIGAVRGAQRTTRDGTAIDLRRRASGRWCRRRPLALVAHGTDGAPAGYLAERLSGRIPHLITVFAEAAWAGRDCQAASDRLATLRAKFAVHFRTQNCARAAGCWGHGPDSSAKCLDDPAADTLFLCFAGLVAGNDAQHVAASIASTTGASAKCAARRLRRDLTSPMLARGGSTAAAVRIRGARLAR